jgi:NADP-dependent 3-hydroxy acid dehydrogenase YdfG
MLTPVDRNAKIRKLDPYLIKSLGVVAEDVADAVVWAVTRPSHVDVDLLVMRPRAQAAQHKVHRTS